MKIITISREFGSGGRELGKRMADLLGWDYYDREIISKIASEQGLDEAYVDRMLASSHRQTITIRRSFSSLPLQTAGADLLGKEKQVIERIAAKGRDCVIVGRNADVYLRALHPFTLFVCASKEAKLRRCRERAEAQEHISDRELERKIRQIDRSRAGVRELVGGNEWGKRDSYQLTVNTTDWEIKDLVPAVASFAQQWYERNPSEA